MNKFDVLKKIAESFEEDSVERTVLAEAAMALHLVNARTTRESLEDFMEKKDAAVTGLELIHLKMCGLDVPEKLKTVITAELDAEISNLAEKLNKLIKQQEGRADT